MGSPPTRRLTGSCPRRPPVGSRHHARQRTPPRIHDVLRRAGSHAGPVVGSDPAPPERADVHELGDDAVRPHLLGGGAGPLRPAPGRHGAEVRACRWQTQRSGRHRSQPPASLVLRDARQLQLRRLLQRGRHPDGVGVRHRGARYRRRPYLGDRPHERRRGRGHLGRPGGLSPRTHPAPRQGQLLGDGRDRPLRAVIGAVLRLRRRDRSRRWPGQRG